MHLARCVARADHFGVGSEQTELMQVTPAGALQQLAVV
jgi:hypothetical protein